MLVDNMIISIKHLDFVNKLDKISYDFLYSQNGYTGLSSVDAVEKYQFFIDKFENEVLKLKTKCKLENIDFIIKEKREIYLKGINEHYVKQSVIWAQDVYQEMISNLLFAVFINKNNKYAIKEIYNKGLCAIEWISGIKKLDNSQFCKLKLKFRNEFINALKSNDSDYLPEKTIQYSDKKTYISLRNMILDDSSKFIEINLTQFKTRLSKKDISFLQKCQNDLQTFKKTSLLDELKLIDCASKILKLNNIDDIYDFLIQVDDDFNVFYFQNKKISQQDKIDILKKRVKLMQDSSKNNYEFYKTVICS